MSDGDSGGGTGLHRGLRMVQADLAGAGSRLPEQVVVLRPLFAVSVGVSEVVAAVLRQAEALST